MENIQLEIIDLIMTVIAGCVGIATRYVVKFMKERGIVSKISSEKEVAKIVVNAVEQIYTHKNGHEKLEIAKDEIVKLANQKGIKLKDTDLDLLIESSVKEMKQELKTELKLK